MDYPMPPLPIFRLRQKVVEKSQGVFPSLHPPPLNRDIAGAGGVSSTRGYRVVTGNVSIALMDIEKMVSIR